MVYRDTDPFTCVTLAREWSYTYRCLYYPPYMFQAISNRRDRYFAILRHFIGLRGNIPWQTIHRIVRCEKTTPRLAIEKYNITGCCRAINYHLGILIRLDILHFKYISLTFFYYDKFTISFETSFGKSDIFLSSFQSIELNRIPQSLSIHELLSH